MPPKRDPTVIATFKPTGGLQPRSPWGEELGRWLATERPGPLAKALARGGHARCETAFLMLTVDKAVRPDQTREGQMWFCAQVRMGDPDYPDEALAAKVEGWVKPERPNRDAPWGKGDIKQISISEEVSG